MRGAISVKRPEILWRAAGLNRPGLIAQLTAPRLATRLAIGIENAPAHAIVDRLLGFDRAFAESRLQLTPVEWGVWTFLILRSLDALDTGPPSDRERLSDGLLATSSVGKMTLPGGYDRWFGLDDLTLDRVGPDPFDPSGLGPIVTVRWAVRVGRTVGSPCGSGCPNWWSSAGWNRRRRSLRLGPSRATDRTRRAAPMSRNIRSDAESSQANGGPRPDRSPCRRD